jgi:hypothetical protein
VNVLEHLREWSASADEWKEMCELQYQLDLPEGPELTGRLNRMADLLDAVADRMERSGLVRAFSTQDAALLREQAATARSGRHPFEVETTDA